MYSTFLINIKNAKFLSQLCCNYCLLLNKLVFSNCVDNRYIVMQYLFCHDDIYTRSTIILKYIYYKVCVYLAVAICKINPSMHRL